MRPILRRRQRAALDPSPDPVPPARHQPIAKIAHATRNPAQHNASSPPRLRQIEQNLPRRVRPREHPLIRTVQAPQHHHRVQPRVRTVRPQSVPRHQFAHLRRLRRHKPQAILPVVSQEPPHCADAEAAVAIKHHQQPVSDPVQSIHTHPDARARTSDSTHSSRSLPPSILNPP